MTLFFGEKNSTAPQKNRENREGEKTKEALFSFVLAGKETKKVNSQKHHYRSIGLPEEEALTKAGFSLLRIKIELFLFVTRKRWWCAFCAQNAQYQVCREY